MFLGKQQDLIRTENTQKFALFACSLLWIKCRSLVAILVWVSVSSEGKIFTAKESFVY